MLEAPPDLALCEAVGPALAAVKQHSAALGRDDATLHAAAELALVASRAERRLRRLAMQDLGTQGAARSAATPPSASASAAPPPSATPSPSAQARLAIQRLRQLAHERDGGVEADAVRRNEPYLPLLRSFTALSAGALRYLGTFLEEGSPGEKGRALSEIERIAPDHTPWHALEQVVHEARLLERDPALLARLGKLDRLPLRARPADAGP